LDEAVFLRFFGCFFFSGFFTLPRVAPGLHSPSFGPHRTHASSYTPWPSRRPPSRCAVLVLPERIWRGIWRALPFLSAEGDLLTRGRKPSLVRNDPRVLLHPFARSVFVRVGGVCFLAFSSFWLKGLSSKTPGLSFSLWRGAVGLFRKLQDGPRRPRPSQVFADVFPPSCAWLIPVAPQIDHVFRRRPFASVLFLSRDTGAFSQVR